jgi:hypothetical protein
MQHQLALLEVIRERKLEGFEVLRYDNIQYFCKNSSQIRTD